LGVGAAPERLDVKGFRDAFRVFDGDLVARGGHLSPKDGEKIIDSGVDVALDIGSINGDGGAVSEDGHGLGEGAGGIDPGFDFEVHGIVERLAPLKPKMFEDGSEGRVENELVCKGVNIDGDPEGVIGRGPYLGRARVSLGVDEAHVEGAVELSNVRKEPLAFDFIERGQELTMTPTMEPNASAIRPGYVSELGNSK